MLKAGLQFYVVAALLLVMLFIPVCELSEYCPLVDYKKDTWSLFR